MTDRTRVQASGLRPALLWLLLGWLAVVYAPGVAGAESLYTTRVPVSSTDESEREAGVRAALSRVLVKLTGRRDVTRDPRARKLLERAEGWVAEYRYLPRTGDGAKDLLEVRFQGPQVRRALQEAGLPLWPTPRPGVLVWAAVEDGGGGRLLEQGDPALTAALVAARDRGMELLLPLLDLEDRSRVRPADVLGGFDETIREASARYAPDGVLIGAAERGGDGTWGVEWRLYLGDTRRGWRSRGATLEAAVTQGIHGLADRLARLLTPAADAGVRPGALLVAVEGIDSMEDFARARAFLAESSALQEVRPWRVTPGMAVFHARTGLDPAAVTRSLSTGGGPLEPLPGRGELESAGERMIPVQRFRWAAQTPPPEPAEPAR